MREAGTIRERVYQALTKRYSADQEEALVKIDALLRGDVIPGHEDLTGSIDKQKMLNSRTFTISCCDMNIST